ncbi:beta-class carbonic anhydrase [Longirhabdus pacifica]|uniref:beta-class carbonic anhydrase n=1 Tax=Longirhabdus pacifica TaxID=2305227 RepID=UPI001008FC99|nr:carbonic anhydrase [Longirhabdus pacifica]
MNTIDNILTFNETFVENKQYEEFETSKFPDKKMVILTCMDARLLELLPKAMNLKNGDVKMVRNAGAIVTEPFENTMRSILVAIYALKAEEVCVIGHHDCGMTGISPSAIIDKMKESGIAEEVITQLGHAGIDLDTFLTGFDSVQEGVKRSVSVIRNHPLLAAGIPVHGLIIDPATGKLERVVDGYKDLKQ